MIDHDPLREIRDRAAARYITIKPRGLILDEHSSPTPCVEARIVGHGGARTLYRSRQPHCRSLNGVHAIDDPENRCGECHLRTHCTPQVRVDLLANERPYRLLLSYTSARLFLKYHDECKAHAVTLDQITTVITVIDRGRWGEVRFQTESSC